MNWKLYGLLAATVMVANPSRAEIGWEEKCEYMGKIAGRVMNNHHNRRPLQESLKEFDDIRPPEFKAILRRIVLRGYDTPRYGTAKHRSDAIKDYADEKLLSCLKAE